ncbi:MAG: hypothetical protein IPP45_07530 [Sphingomonadales bacterium]|nr:hypothetical protein [Sphingomonadales bacterium]
MELLFKREQTPGKLTRVNFKLWAKIEVTEDEQALIDRYRMKDALLIESDDSELQRFAIRLGIVVFVAATALFGKMMGMQIGLFLGCAAGLGAGYWYMNEHRETIYVRDLLHGRNFTCLSVVALAKKEAWLDGTSYAFRQIVEAAKHWDGVEKFRIDPLPKEQAKELILRIG